MTETLLALIPRLAGKKVLVIGDLILDEYLLGDAVRMSREAPVPVLEFTGRHYIPGGAANPAANIAALGGQALLTGIVGEDDSARILRELLAARGIVTEGIITDHARPTTLKTRIMAQMGLRFPQQVARIDTLSRRPIEQHTAAALLDFVRAQAPQADALLVSDYHGGLLTNELVGELRSLAQEFKLLLTADAQGHLEKYRGFGLVKCNADDAALYLARALQSDADFAAAAQELCTALALSGGMVITRGAAGATLGLAGGGAHHAPAPAVRDVFDTVGAGDTSIAVLTLAAAAGAAHEAAVTLANYASGIVVQHPGNYTPTPDELAAAIRAGR